MAQKTTNKKTSTTNAKNASSRTTAGKRTSASKTAPKHSGASRNPRRREISALVCFLLSIFTFIGYWNSEGAFIGLFCGLAKALLGSGFYVLPPALFMCSIILTFHRGRPVRFRVISALMLTVIIGSLAHLFIETPEYKMSFSMFASLWTDGLMLKSGGAISGSLAEVFNWAFAKAGAATVLICAVVFFSLVAINRTISGIVDAIKSRERLQYVPQPEPEPKPRTSRTQEKKDTKTPVQASSKAIDIPIDTQSDVTEADEKSKKSRGSFFSATPRVKTPDQLISQYAMQENDAIATEPDGAESEINDEEIIDMPLDIPFMETRSKGERSVELSQERSNLFNDLQTIIEKESLHDEAINDNIDGNEVANFETTDENEMSDISSILANIADTVNIIDTANNANNTDIADTASNESNTSNANTNEDEPTYVFPPIDLLNAGTPGTLSGVEDEVETNRERLEAAFRSFGVNVTISNSTRGPAVTRYEAELEAGIKLSRLTGLADDIALSLGASGVRIAAMPNKISTVGIEVPNKTISTVNLRDIIESKEFQGADSKMTFALGMDISGESIVGNVSKLPHLLVAGTTGSGKSVCLNSIILSILYKASPDDVRFIMIDPKMVEFKVYNNIPHLLVPVVTDVKKAAGALQWAVVEMMKRYSLFSETNARDIEGYNQIAKTSDEYDGIPQVVIVIDELADLMMMAAREVEESVCRVAQMGRAAGMHLVIATQSPRADVITGLMKANIPSRVALKVSSALESRIILDAGGNADKLVGNGDMLYAPVGTAKPLRVQGTWVSDAEREKVVEFIKNGGQSQYSEEVMDEIEKAAVDKSSGDKSKDEQGDNDYDELVPSAVDVIFETGQASVSMLQRRLKLGYSRAARIVDQLEALGVVGPFEGSKPRTVLVTKEQWQQMQYISGNAPIDTPYIAPVVSVRELIDDSNDDSDDDSNDYDDDMDMQLANENENNDEL
ncbi:MAG: DNA translocase FtsK [Oscillospiraceae bacterium]|nr:DNA translocase FtsK [Oscillospiraceae bacterium]